MTTARTGLIVFSVLALAGAVGCTKEQRSDLADEGAEALVRNAVSAAGVAAFEREGYEVDGSLDCEATSTGGAERIQVSCTGTSADGQELAIEGEAETGAAEGDDNISGSFVGSADGTEVFSEDCLGQGC
jgi:hypothetical protein